MYNIKKENGDRFELSAYINPQTMGLVLSGWDYSNAAGEMFDDKKYEYSYIFSKEATEKLIVVLNYANILKGLNKFFNGQMKNSEFKKICEKENIDFEMHVV